MGTSMSKPTTTPSRRTFIPRKSPQNSSTTLPQLQPPLRSTPQQLHSALASSSFSTTLTPDTSPNLCNDTFKYRPTSVEIITPPSILKDPFSKPFPSSKASAFEVINTHPTAPSMPPIIYPPLLRQCYDLPPPAPPGGLMKPLPTPPSRISPTSTYTSYADGNSVVIEMPQYTRHSYRDTLPPLPLNLNTRRASQMKTPRRNNRSTMGLGIDMGVDMDRGMAGTIGRGGSRGARRMREFRRSSLEMFELEVQLGIESERGRF